MEQSTITILPHHCFVKDISQTRFAANYKKWKQRKLHTMLSLSIMGNKRIIAISTHCANDAKHISGLPP